MSIYLKQFSTHSEYEAYIASEGKVLPNVSICTTEGDVHYNPWVETRVVAKFNITNISNPTRIAKSTSNFSEIEIDDSKQPSVTTGYTFDTVGEHTVKYTLTDPTSIGYSAFYGCSSLTSITIPDSVTSIGDNAFFNCTGLTNCTIGSGVTSIGNEAFYICSSLRSITIPDSVTSIGDNAFAACSSLTSIDIPNGVTSIGSSVFIGCSGLTSCTIGSGVTSIGNEAFANCSSLTSMTVDSNNTSYDSRNNCNGIINTSTNTLIAGCKNTVIPNSVTSIGDNAFRSCTGLTSIDIPSGVTSIGNYVFIYCSGLTSIVSNATTAPTISNKTFQSVNTGGTLTVPQGSSGYDTWMGTGDYYLGKYNWTKVEQ